MENYVKFRMRTQLIMEDGEISSMFTQGKAPSMRRPPKPLPEINIPKLKAEPSSKPKIKTGVLKPKPKVSGLLFGGLVNNNTSMLLLLLGHVVYMCFLSIIQR